MTTHSQDLMERLKERDEEGFQKAVESGRLISLVRKLDEYVGHQVLVVKEKEKLRPDFMSVETELTFGIPKDRAIIDEKRKTLTIQTHAYGSIIERDGSASFHHWKKGIGPIVIGGDYLGGLGEEVRSRFNPRIGPGTWLPEVSLAVYTGSDVRKYFEDSNMKSEYLKAEKMLG